MSFIIGLIIGALVGGVATYLSLRNNPKYKARLDEKVGNWDEKH